MTSNTLAEFRGLQRFMRRQSVETRRKISQTMTGRIRGPYTTPNKTDAAYERQTVKKYQEREQMKEAKPGELV